MAPFTKPEAVLKQAEGLVSVGQTHAALQSLTEMFTSKRFRSTPLSSLEPILLRFVQLCVDMRKGRTAKEGLMQYKNIAQNTNVASIEVVIQRFLTLADAKVQEAQEKADKAVAVDVDDLEASETPESILLGAVSGDQSKDRTDRALVTPWLKFLWESYRTSLETLKNNARLEAIYQQVAQQAFRFCLKHQRKVEFRRLCETLRLHLSNVAKYAHQTHAINLSDPEILQHHLDTRFAQLNTSVELELWQEAFRSVEDVHNLLTMAKKAPRPAMMANYYEKLTKIFLMSGNSLYHAAAWGRYYVIVTSIGGKSEEELSRLAGQVLVSALAVPVGLHGDEDEGKGKSGRLAALLGLTKAPTRAGLLKDALSHDVLRLSPAPIKTLYNLLEASFDPLSLIRSTAPLLSSLCAPGTPYAGYLPLLSHALLSRLLSQLSQVYSTLKLSALFELVAPLQDLQDGAAGKEKVEAYLMGCARRGELRVRIDHATETISFVDDAFAHAEDAAAAAGPSTSTHREASVQPSSAELVRTRLSVLARALQKAVRVIDPAAEEEEEAAQAKRVAELVAAAQAERHRLSLRRALIARRRELLSELSQRKEKEEASRRAEQLRARKLVEEAKEKDDAKRKELERARKEIESIRTEEAKKLAADLVKRGGLKVPIQDMEDLSKDSLMRLQVEQLEKEKKDLNERLRIASKRIDHIERAYRKDERPLLAQDYADQQASDRTTFEAVQKARVEGARKHHEEAVRAKKRMERMLEDYRGHKENLLSQRSEEFQKRRAAAQSKIEEEKERRRQAYAEEKAQERREREEAEEAVRKAEEDRARAEAEQRAEEEAEAARKREEEEKLAETRRAREAERAAAAEEARRKAQREAEAEERAAARRAHPNPASAPAAAATETGAWRRSGPAPGTPSQRAAALPTPPRAESPAPSPVAAAPAKYRAPGAGGGWRQREAEKGATGGTSPAGRSPAVTNAALPESKKDNDGFEPVPEKKVWRPRRLQGSA
ncbi:hypothetical protein HYDPIDRAFT_173905 [Hydnomerulius pinastri MD-312]|nr:hypothetical protein HYDPIDRAFT_173905 [Hydnomerulius pinastri MD-312]